jgi:molecular chaperone DnaJ
MPITFAQAALGAEMTVPTIDGQARLKIPAGTQPGSTLRMRGKGLARRLRVGRGDQLVEIQVEVPKQLTPRARELITALSSELGQPTIGTDDSFLGRLKRWL